MKLLSVVLVAFVLLANLFTAKPAVASDDDNNLVSSICNFVAADDKNRLRKKLKNTNVKLRNIYDGVMCDGLSVLQFAMKKNANNVGVYIVKRLPTSKFADGSDIAWAADNGFSASEIIVAIKERSGGGDDDDDN